MKQSKVSTQTYHFVVILILFSLFIALCRTSYATPDDIVMSARTAGRQNNTALLQRLLPQVGDHPLASYVEFWLLRSQKLMDKDEARSFLDRYRGTPVADRLRNVWLKQMANLGDFSEFAKEAPQLQFPDQEAQCALLTNRLNQKDGKALLEADKLWLKITGASKTCQPVIEALVWNQRVTLNDVWARARRHVEDKQLNQVANTLRYLPESQVVSFRLINQALRQPERFIASSLGSDRTTKELAALALSIIARGNPTRAADMLSGMGSRLGDEATSWVWGQIGWFAAQNRMEQTTVWLDRSFAANLSNEPAEWRVRAYLLNNDWTHVLQAIAALPKDLQSEPAWLYWQGRALKARGDMVGAKPYFEKLLGELGYYSALAEEELGRLPSAVGRAAPASDADMARVGALPEVKRAFILADLEMRPEALFELNWVTRSMNDRDLLALAALAAKSGFYDLSIATAAKTKSEHDLTLRFPMPNRATAEPIIKSRNLDEAWVYGLMRQESRFITNARSSVGATGLMQIMPATAKYVANKIGMTGFNSSSMRDINSNVQIGTAYMRMVLDGLDNSPVLATAAYNAGPGRANRWRTNKTIEGAIYAENIPFSETRNYVKYVMANAVYYAAVVNGRPDSLKARLGAITPPGVGSTQTSASLP